MPKRKPMAHQQRAAAVAYSVAEVQSAHMPPRSNDVTSAALQEFAIARMVRAQANAYYEVAKAEVYNKCHVPSETGTHVIHDDASVFADVSVHEQHRIDAEVLATLLAERFDIDVPEAQAIINDSRVPSLVRTLSVTLKR